MHPRTVVIVALALVALAPAPAHAFCGFYIDGGGKKLTNEATMVVLMRQGTRTVLSMRNTYKGPVEDFAMVVPVPVVLAETDVKTLTPDVFDRVDVMGSPRLVEYWEQDPCGGGYGRGRGDDRKKSKAPMAAKADRDEAAEDLGVTIEAEFTVAEYEIVILSAKDSTGLDTWLRQEDYKIPAKAEAALRPYVEAGMKFFVAKVDPTKVKFENKRALLSPLRFHYDSETFDLPIRLGLINSAGKQDLIVNILAPGQRYEVANYKNVTIPTNIEVKDEVRNKFPEFYAALFDRTLEKNPGAVVTEYAWDAGTCDPCPGPVLGWNDFNILGADVLDGSGGDDQVKGKGRGRRGGGGFVLTRLHARYGAKDMKDDLVFKEADPIVGGREHVVSNGKLEEGSQTSSINNFQGRYIIRHLWTGKIACKNPQRGIWGGPTNQNQIAHGKPKPAQNLAFAPRGKMKLPRVVKQRIPELGIKPYKKPKKKKVVPKEVSPPVEAPPVKPGAAVGIVAVLVVGAIAARRRRRRRH
jgi:MYXO-CTERM domain-containing protein